MRIDRAFGKHLLGAALGDPATWATWLVVLRAAFGLTLDEAEERIFTDIAGGRKPPISRVRELWAVVGRRAGKSRMAAAVACYQALFVKHKLAIGEVGMVLVCAASQAQARTVFGYIRGFLEASPALAREVVAVKHEAIELKNGIVIAVHSTSFRTVRGRTLVAAVFDEVAYWRSDTSATPDTETFTVVLPSLATTNGMLVGISTPYRKLGLLHQKHRDHYGVDGDDVLVVQGPSKVFNPSLADAVIAAQRAADPTAAGAEWDADFRADISAYLDDALIDGAVEHGRPLELLPRGGNFYLAFTDPAGGVGQDAYTVALGHRERDERVIVDVLRGTSGKFDPEETTKQYAVLLKQYGVGQVTGDSYGAEWVAATWQRCGISYVRSERTKSECYLEAVPLFARGLVRLPDHPKLLRELRLLERHTHRSGRDTVDHPKGGRDDYANATCGVAVLLGVNAAGWMRSENLKPVIARLQAMGPYRRPLGDGRANGESIYGERRWAQMQAMRDKRTYGW